MSYRYGRHRQVQKQPAVIKVPDRVIRLPPFHYIHVLDSNRNITDVEIGPNSFIRKDHQQVVKEPSLMTTIPPRHYCVVGNPCVRDKEGKPIYVDGQVKLNHGVSEVRLSTEWLEPFPLYPGEQLLIDVTVLEIIPPNTAFLLQANQDFQDGQDIRLAGDQWLIHGPRTFIPRIEYTKLESVESITVEVNTALRIRAKYKFFDKRKQVERKAGEEWLYKDPGSFLPEVEEEVKEVVKARILTEKKALQLLAEHTFTDVYGKLRKAGEEWLVTKEMTSSSLHLPDVYEMVVKDVHAITLTKLQYCIVMNPVQDNGLPRWETKEVRKGECSFFLQPGEKLVGSIQEVKILGEDDALLIKAIEGFTETIDNETKKRSPGELWMVYGPRQFVPPVEIEIIEPRKKIPLDQNEGIYIRNVETGKVSTIRGESYMLKPNEVLWEKELSPLCERLLVSSAAYLGLEEQKNCFTPRRIKHKAVTYRVPHNAAVQVYDYKTRKSRVIFGPEMVMLEPEEQLSIMTLSGGIPKRPGQIVSFCLQLGPDFMRDKVIVETSDHAQLQLKLSYNWKFRISKDCDEKERHQIFSVRDFVGDTCKNIAARVRGKVASVPFEEFHKNSCELIRQAVFGKHFGKALLFSDNLLVVENVDIQSVEPVEQRTRDALQKSVQLAIEIATSSQEALAHHEALKEEEIAGGAMQRQKIQGQVEAEGERKSLVTLKAKTASLRAIGKAQADAQAEADAAIIQAKCGVEQAKKQAEAHKIKSEARLAHMRLKNQQDLHFRNEEAKLEILKATEECKIESEKFEKIVKAIGTDTIEAIASAGPRMQAELLNGLGLEGFLVTDGTSPINLFNTASGLVGSQ